MLSLSAGNRFPMRNYIFSSELRSGGSMVVDPADGLEKTARLEGGPLK